MNAIFKSKSTRLLSAFLAVLMVVAMLPVTAFAWTAEEGTKCTSTYGDLYLGSDGNNYYSKVGNTLFYNDDGSFYVSYHNGGVARYKYLMIDSNGTSHHVYCIESGVSYNYSDTYNGSSGKNSKYFQNLPVTAQYGIMMALMYGWHDGAASPISGTNVDDFIYATQCIIWEYQQQIRTSPTSLASANGVEADLFYATLKDRTAEKCYNWILEQMSKHYVVPSFSSRNQSNAQTYTMKYDQANDNYSITLTDTNNTLADINFSASGITVTRSGNQYTFTSKNMISNAVMISAQKKTNLGMGKMLIWGCPGKQTMASGAEDPVFFYLKLNTETYGVGHIVKTSEDGKVEGIKFNISGNGVNETVTTGKNGTVDLDLLPGTYTVTEQTDDKYETQSAQTVTIVSGKTSTVTFNNTLRRGDLKVTKTAEDGLVEGMKFHLYGTSYCGLPVDEYAVTNASGIAVFDDVLIGTGYTLEEVGTPDRYIVPDNQTAAIEWNKVTNKSFDNDLKRGDLKVTKTAEDGLNEGLKFHLYGTSYSGIAVDEYAVTDATGVATFSNILIGTGYTLEEVETPIRYVVPDNQTAAIEWDKVTNKSFDNVLKKWNLTVTKQDVETGSAQGDANLAGAKYGIYKGDELIDTYVTDADGKFTTKYYICGNDWSIKELDSSEGYLVTPGNEQIGVDPKNYTAEYNSEAMKQYEQVKKGNIAIIKHTDDGQTQIETPEEGAEFAVYLKSAGSYDNAKDSECDYLICDENGFAQTKDLPYGRYTVQQIKGWEGREPLFLGSYHVVETKAPYGMILNPTVQTVELTYAGQEVEITETSTSFYNERQKVEIDLNKVMEQNEVFNVGNNGEITSVNFGLFAAEEIVAADGSSIPAGWVLEVVECDENGYAAFSTDLPVGAKTYVKEISTDKHYVLSDKEYPVVFEYAGQEVVTVHITVNDGKDIPNELIYGMIKGYKVNRETGDKISGALFGLYRADETSFTEANALLTAESGEDGVFTFENVVYGSYTVRELRPAAGYLENETVYAVTVDKDGDVVEITVVNDLIPEIGTTATIDEEKEVCATEVFTLTDTVEYKHLVPGKEYTVKGILMDKATGDPFLQSGEQITSEVTFVPEAPSGSVEVLFTFDAKLIKADTNIVVFESLYSDSKELTVHADIEDEEQTVTVIVPEIKTEASTDGKKETTIGGEITIEDIVFYRNLTPGKEYVVKGTLMNKTTGKPVTVNDEPVTAEAAFTPETRDGEVKVTFTFNSYVITETTDVVVFESLYREDVEIAVHADIEDEGQSVKVYVPEIKTTASIDGKKEITTAGKVTIEDVVCYTNLIPGTE